MIPVESLDREEEKGKIRFRFGALEVKHASGEVKKEKKFFSAGTRRRSGKGFV